MKKVIKGEFEKIKDVKVKDVSLTCDTPLEVSTIKSVNYAEWMMIRSMKLMMTLDMIRDDEVELTYEESSDNVDEVSETYLLRTLRDSRPMKTTRMIGSMNGTKTHHRSMRSHGLTLEFGPNPHQLNIIASLSTLRLDIRNGQHVVGWMMDTVMEETYPELTLLKPTPLSRLQMDDGYCNGGNLPGTYIIGNQLYYQDYEWYEALEDSELKDEALRNKAIMDGFMNDDDESRYE
nr:hypothetical protein [Tanacetum cinerariifolium]